MHWIEQPDACLDLAECLQFLVGQLHAAPTKAGAGDAKLGAGLIERAGARHGDPIGPVGEALIAALYGGHGALLNAPSGLKQPRRCLAYLARRKCAQRGPRGLTVLSEGLHALDEPACAGGGSFECQMRDFVSDALVDLVTDASEYRQRRLGDGHRDGLGIERSEF